MGARKRPTPPKEDPRRGRTIAPVAAAPQSLPALFERAASAANFDVEALGKLLALKREIDAHADRRAFDLDFAALQAEVGRVDINALDDAVRTSISAKGNTGADDIGEG